MRFSWGSANVPRRDDVDEDRRGRLADIADIMIPAAHGMPSASSVDVAGGQLDIVLFARDDLAEPLLRALDSDIVPDVHSFDTVDAWLVDLHANDAEAHDALVKVVIAGYYLSPKVCGLLGYPGQMASEVTLSFPEYVDEGLLDAVVARGPLFRDVP